MSIGYVQGLINELSSEEQKLLIIERKFDAKHPAVTHTLFFLAGMFVMWLI